ncbi:preprotein translocase subunit SecG [Glaciecola petra]|uniref:Protein-export membrane protein SecG n=1 Tax=Glaciecola petra TaxID=3075602 RepID=A0ABU2ZSV5_9ALTE|nr:preprotein translocase subunit SecG [Aestuariibacter sp. P117]MDT0594502.1 preprotein translocase subunit SecG [Aestuariibacter sp. P117]
MLYELLLIAYLVVAIALVGFVLLQQGKGADMGASFGAGGANTIFGSSGSGNFMTRTTAILATLFFAISLIIGGMTAGTSDTTDEFQNIEVPVDDSIPVLPNDSDIPVANDAPAVEPSDVPETTPDDQPNS